MEVPLICLTKSYLLSATAVNCMPTALEMITSFDNFKNLTVRYSKQSFTFLMVYFTLNWLLVYAISVILVC